MSRAAGNIRVQVFVWVFVAPFVSAKEMTAWSYGEETVSSVRNHQTVPGEWLPRFALPPAMTERPCCLTSSPARGGVGILDVGHGPGCADRPLFYFAFPC